MSLLEYNQSHRKAMALRGADYWFIQGTVNGLAWANGVLAQNGAPPLYCQPSKMALTGEQVLDILNRYLDERLAEKSKKWEGIPLGLGVLFALQEVFPCK
jgi:hypothetical protein